MFFILTVIDTTRHIIERVNFTICKLYSNILTILTHTDKKKKKHPQKSPGSDGFSDELCQTFQNKILSIYYTNSFRKNGKRKHFPACFMNQYNPDTKTKDITRKESNRTLCLMNMDTKTFSKILANQIRQYKKYKAI